MEKMKNCWIHKRLSFIKVRSIKERLNQSECYSNKTEVFTMVNKENSSKLVLVNWSIAQEVSKKATGNKISLMVLTAEFLTARLEIFTLGQWKRARETAEEDSMTLNEMRYMMEILRWINAKEKAWYTAETVKFWKENSEITSWKAPLNMCAGLALLKSKKYSITLKEAVAYILPWTRKRKRKCNQFWEWLLRTIQEWTLQTKVIWDKVCTLTRKKTEVHFNKMIDLS